MQSSNRTVGSSLLSIGVSAYQCGGREGIRKDWNLELAPMFTSLTSVDPMCTQWPSGQTHVQKDGCIETWTFSVRLFCVH